MWRITTRAPSCSMGSTKRRQSWPNGQKRVRDRKQTISHRPQTCLRNVATKRPASRAQAQASRRFLTVASIRTAAATAPGPLSHGERRRPRTCLSAQICCQRAAAAEPTPASAGGRGPMASSTASVSPSTVRERAVATTLVHAPLESGQAGETSRRALPLTTAKFTPTFTWTRSDTWFCRSQCRACTMVI
jgi:hypothetical protein